MDDMSLKTLNLNTFDVESSIELNFKPIAFAPMSDDYD